MVIEALRRAKVAQRGGRTVESVDALVDLFDSLLLAEEYQVVGKLLGELDPDEWAPPRLDSDPHGDARSPRSIRNARAIWSTVCVGASQGRMVER